MPKLRFMNPVVDVTRIESRLIRLEHQLREMEFRILDDQRKRNLKWLELASSGMLVIARMLGEIAPPRKGQAS